MKVWIVLTGFESDATSVHAREELARLACEEYNTTNGFSSDSEMSAHYEEYELRGAPPYLKDYGDEPVFVLRGKDSLTPWTIASYMHSCRQKGLHDQAEEVDKALHEVMRWQRHNPDKVKLPDHPHVPVK